MTDFVVESRERADSAGRARVRVSADSPWFDGHFDGAPVLPGVAHFALGESVGAFDATAIVAVTSARMRVPVLPGDIVDVEWTRHDNSIELRVARGGRPASAFSLIDGVDRAVAAAVEPRTVDVTSSLDLDRVLPHRRRARLIASVGAFDGESLSAAASVGAEHPFATGGRAPSSLALELAAQAAAAHGALSAATGGGPRAPRGFLVGARDVVLAAPAIPCDVPHDVVVARSGSAPPLQVYRFTISRGRKIASGEISVYVETG